MDIFNANNFVLSSCDKRQRIQSLEVVIAMTVFFMASAFTFMNFLYCLCDCLGSVVCHSNDVAIRDAIRSMPIFLSFFMTLTGVMACHAFFRNESKQKLLSSLKKHAYFAIVSGVVIIVYVLVMRVAGVYVSLVEGSPSAIYPLDSVLYSLLFVALGTGTLYYVNKLADRYEYVGPVRPSAPKKLKVLYNVGFFVWLIVALYGFCGFFYSFFIVDFAHGYAFFSIASVVASLVALLSIVVWEFFYNELKVEARAKVLLPLASTSLAVTLLTAIVYFVALKFNLDGPSNVGFGLLPIAFAASVNLATIIVVVTPAIVSFIALIKGIILKSIIPHQ